MKFIAAFSSLLALANGLTIKRQSCSNPSTRVEWRDLHDDQKSSYIEAVKCLKDTPSRLSSDSGSASLYDDFANVHRQLDSGIHFVSSFLPWHRWFLWLFEQALQNDCNYDSTIPYWDWTLDYAAGAFSPVFDADTGFGGDGDESTLCIASGSFVDFNVSTPDNHCLQRKFDMSLLEQYNSPSEVNTTLEYSSYSAFRPGIESGLHRGGHGAIAGDMANNYSPNDPVFFLHHGAIDRVWWEWQSANSSRLTEYSGNRYQNDSSVEGSLSDVLSMVDGWVDSVPTVEDVMWVQNDIFCYTY
ncbi:Tyrosinase ustQ [Colletotrichum aenigma]|uniref:Tyrosinase ustQ n=1 Tax=Colletotrichum aenigma TaxID=1215731 RepID=UPI001872A19B|nr:Tyrosinase ustQ [Colletotrichum aenigma]KAF5519311.1 Tyrosinase ustQ [Colletotrichum aenigma]